MIATRRFNREPWVEALIQNYGHQGKAKILKGYILEAGELPGSHAQRENAVALLLISDGTVSMSAVLTKQGWERLQEMEERDTVFGLKKCTVFLQVYSLQFQCEAEMVSLLQMEMEMHDTQSWGNPFLCKSKFFLTVDKMATVAFGAAHGMVPCCTTLPTVRQKICETWKSLQGENSVTLDTMSEISLSTFITAWFEDEMKTLLADLKPRLATTSLSPQPSTSRADPPPAASSAHLSTGWRLDRGQYREQETFTVPVSHLCIPPEQMDLMQRHPDGEGELQLQDDVTSERSVEHEETAPPNSGPDGSSLISSGEQEKGTGNPWDIFAPAMESLSTSSVEDEESPSLLPALERDCAAAAVPLATSTQSPPLEGSNSRELFTTCLRSDQSDGDGQAIAENSPVDTERQESGRVPEPCSLEVSPPKSEIQPSSTPSLTREVSNGSDNQTLPPYPKPRPHNALSGSPVQDGSLYFTSDPFRPKDNLESHLTTRQLCPPGSSICYDDEEGGGVVSRWRRAKAKQRSSTTEADEDGDTTESHQRAVKEKREHKDEHTGHAPKRRRSQTGSPPSWLFHSPALERNGEQGPCDRGVTKLEGGAASTTNIRRLTTTHPDGTRFFYRYKPTPQVAEALSNFKIPDDLVRWSMRYLGSSDGSKKTN